jgi:hypothetical protein
VDSKKCRLGADQEILCVNISPSKYLEYPLLGQLGTLRSSIIVRECQGSWSIGHSIVRIFKRKLLQPSKVGEWGTVLIAHDVDELYSWCGLWTAGQLFYRQFKDSLVISNDLRLLMTRDPGDFDPVGFYSLFHFGAVSAPFTLFKKVRRVPPGHVLRFFPERLCQLSNTSRPS